MTPLFTPRALRFARVLSIDPTCPDEAVLSAAEIAAEEETRARDAERDALLREMRGELASVAVLAPGSDDFTGDCGNVLMLAARLHALALECAR